MARMNKHTTVENPNYRVITVEEPLSLAAESYRRIKTSLEFANVDTRGRCSRRIRISVRQSRTWRCTPC